MQSPIDFANNKIENVSNLGILQKLYKPSNATLLNRGHDIMVRTFKFKKESTLIMNYKLKLFCNK